MTYLLLTLYCLSIEFEFFSIGLFFHIFALEQYSYLYFFQMHLVTKYLNLFVPYRFLWLVHQQELHFFLVNIVMYHLKNFAPFYYNYLLYFDSFVIHILIYDF